MESCEARLSFSIIGDGIHEHADPPHPLRLLRPCRERPCRRAAKRDNELPPSNMDCHVTLPWGSCNGGDDITPGRAALRDFKPAYDCSGSIATDEVEVTRSRMSASPLKADNLHTISASPLSAKSRREQMQRKQSYSITSS